VIVVILSIHIESDIELKLIENYIHKMDFVIDPTQRS